jgi:hypothetical protein
MRLEMSAEDQYKTIERPIIPDVDTLFVLRRTGTVRFPMNTLQDIVTEAGVNQGVSPNDDLFTWSNFVAMVEGVYGNLLQTAIDANPIGEGEDVSAWWLRVTNSWLVDYMYSTDGMEADMCRLRTSPWLACCHRHELFSAMCGSLPTRHRSFLPNLL